MPLSGQALSFAAQLAQRSDEVGAGLARLDYGVDEATFGGEDCLSCPTDCNGVQSGNPGNQYCCGDGAGTNPVDCSDSRCTASGYTCDAG